MTPWTVTKLTSKDCGSGLRDWKVKVVLGKSDNRRFVGSATELNTAGFAPKKLISIDSPEAVFGLPKKETGRLHQTQN